MKPIVRRFTFEGPRDYYCGIEARNKAEAVRIFRRDEPRTRIVQIENHGRIKIVRGGDTK